MSLKLKSENSLSDFEFLRADDRFQSSIHCAYYSCVQLCKHILIDKLNLENEVEKNTTRIHKYIQEALFHDMKEKKSETFKAIDFQKEIGNLKLLRGKADYQQELTTEPECQKALSLTTKVHTILTEIYLEQ